MALTRDSGLLWWRARDLVPFIGGDIVFSRAGAAGYYDRAGVLRSAIVDGTREEWELLGGVPTPGLLLERGGTNRLTESDDFSSWTGAGATEAATTDPAGGSAAWRITATVNGGHRAAAVTGLVNGTNVLSIRLRYVDAPLSHIGLFDATTGGGTGAWRHLVLVDWSNGVPTPVSGAGSGRVFQPRRRGNGYWDIEFQAENVVAANTNVFYVYPAGQGATGSTDAFRAQAEDSTYPTSPIESPGAATPRVVDQCYITQAPAPQAMAAYLRWWPRNVITSEHYWNLGGGDPRLVLYSVTGAIRAFHHNGTASVEAAAPATIEPGQLCEAVIVLHADGSVRLYLAQGEGAQFASAGPTSAPSGGLAAAWLNPRWWLNGRSTPGANGAGVYEKLCAVKLADMTNQPGTASAAAIIRELREYDPRRAA